MTHGENQYTCTDDAGECGRGWGRIGRGMGRGGGVGHVLDISKSS